MWKALRLLRRCRKVKRCQKDSCGCSLILVTFFIHLYLGLVNAVDKMTVEEVEEDKEKDDKNEAPAKPTTKRPKKDEADGTAGVDAEMQKKIKQLQAEHTDLTRRGRAEDAAFIATQIKELETFVKEHNATLKKLLDDEDDEAEEFDEDDEDDEGESKEFDEDDLSINLSVEEEMDVDKVNGKRKGFNVFGQLGYLNCYCYLKS